MTNRPTADRRRGGGRWPRPVAFGSVAVAAALALAACASSSSSASSGAGGAATPVRVGYLLPLTGVFTSNGTSEEDGFKLGLKTFGTSVDGHPIDVTYLNTEGEPTVALSDATQLVSRDHVQVVEGPLVSSEIAVVAPYVLGQGIPEDDLYLASPKQEQEYTTTHLGFTSDWNGYQPTTEGALWAYNTMHWRHVTTVGLNISYGWQGVGGFEAEFKKLGGTIDKSIWVPSNAVEMSSYVSSIPSSTQAVFVVLSGAQAANFVNTYAQFGYKSKIPLMGITTLTDQAALPAEHASAALGVYTDAQYCDDLPSAVNQTFANAYHAAYGVYPSYYSEAGYTKAEILVSALKSLHGDVTSEPTLAKAMQDVKVSAPRGPVSLSPVTFSPIENEYICKVEMVNGTLRNVPILTYPNVQPWGALSRSVFETNFAQQASGPPS
jgi:branched-chain amino acid transport system substrate-binding protein